jgi:AhpD family alkylhydroperoxidase
MADEVKNFQKFRQQMNKRILASQNREIKRFFALDKNAYQEGALPVETKELMGLVASMVLRCNDCVKYHLQRCVALKLTNEQLFEAFNVALVVAGSIVIPHLRQAVSFLDEMRREED